MKIITKITSLCIAFATSAALALNVGYLPSDAHFRSAISKDDWEKILKEENGPVKLPYWFGSWVLCGYAGQGALVFEDIPKDLRKLVRTVLDDPAMWRQDEGDGKGLMDGPLFIFCSNDFELTKHSVLNSYNPNREAELGIYESGKPHAKRMAEHSKKKSPIPENAPTKLGAKLPFDPKTAELGHEYDGTAIPPEEYQVIVVSNAYAVLLEELDGNGKKSKGKAYRLLDGEISALSYSQGKWTPTTSTEHLLSPD